MNAVIRYAALLVFCARALAQTDWPSYGNDAGAMRYAPLLQIDRANVAQLKLAWTFRTAARGSEAIPVVVGGVMYATAPDGVYALVPETGELLWKYDAKPVALRGLAFWPGPAGSHSRVFAGNGPYLLALDVTTGKPAPGFGNEGRVDLRAGVSGGLKDPRYALQSPPAIFGDIVITGCSNGEQAPSAGAYGDIRGWDAKTGKLLWTFHTVPRPGEPGAETWPDGGWKNRSGTNVWGFFTIDTKRGIVYAPLGAPTSDFYGADRIGDNLYGNTLVALDARTGVKKWHQQLVHHDLWDYDLAAPPALFDIHHDGRVVPAVAQITKMGLLFVFDRVTGEPVYGIEEKPVPQTAIPGEVTSKTQPFPIKPPPLARNTFRIEDVYNRSPDHERFCRELFESNGMKIGGPFTPMPLEGNALFFPSTIGGGNWGGVSIDPVLGRLFVNVMNVGQWGHMEKRGPEYVRTSAYGPYARFWNRETRIPCQNPPFGEMIAVDLASGEIAWRSVLGRTEALEKIGVKNTGALNMGGSISTEGGLVFIAATNDSSFRAFDSGTGKLLWETKLEANGHSSPITYMGRDKRQYVALMATGGGGYLGGVAGNTLVAFALPDGKTISRTTATPRVGTFAAVALPEGEAKALVEKTCGTGCHSLDVVTSQRMNRAEWNSVVENMVARGARASNAQAGAIVEYLSKTLAPEPKPASPFNYRQVMIPMRDGVHLQTVILTPIAQSKPLPVLLRRTPYGVPEEAYAPVPANLVELQKDGYIFVVQNLRGRFKSEGVFKLSSQVNLSDPNETNETTDAYDTVEWLVHNVANNNGRVGIFGVSYDGLTAGLTLLKPHPALKAISEQASPADQWMNDDNHRYGALRLSYSFEYAVMEQSDKNENKHFEFDAYDSYDWYLNLGPLSNLNARYLHNSIPFWNDTVEHPDYDAFWRREAWVNQVKGSTVPNLNVAGFWDQEDPWGPWQIFRNSEKNDPEQQNFMVAGPWFHGAWHGPKGDKLGDLSFGGHETAREFRENIEAPFFRHYLHGAGEKFAWKASTFQAGSNSWHTYSEWPPKAAKLSNLYFHDDGTLSFNPPTATGTVEYVSDPANPVPYRQRPISPTYPGGDWRTWEAADQRFADHRPDVLSFRSAPLESDLAVTGQLSADLFASTSGTDSDFIVKLIDLFPDDAVTAAWKPDSGPAPGEYGHSLNGYQLPVAMEVRRGRYNTSYEHPAPLVADKVTEFLIPLRDHDYVFRKGHRLMVQVQSTWFPVIDRNPQKFVASIFAAKASDYVKATQRVSCSPGQASHIVLPVMP